MAKTLDEYVDLLFLLREAEKKLKLPYRSHRLVTVVLSDKQLTAIMEAVMFQYVHLAPL